MGEAARPESRWVFSRHFTALSGAHHTISTQHPKLRIVPPPASLQETYERGVVNMPLFSRKATDKVRAWFQPLQQ